MKEPPSKLHELLALALGDYDVIKNDPRYQIDMGSWHCYDAEDKICYLCLAGCVIAKTLEYSHTMCVYTLDVSDRWINASAYLNNLREGVNPYSFRFMFTVTDYILDPIRWRTDMRHFLEYLQLENL